MTTTGMGAKHCGTCKRSVPVDCFDRCASTPDGRHWRCKECKRESNRRSYRARPSHYRAAWARWASSSPRRYISQLHRAAVVRLKGKSSTITVEDLMAVYEAQGGLCCYSGVAMTTIRGRGRVDTNVSIDRIDNSLPYVKGNVVLCCYYLNVSCGRASIDEWLMWADRVKAHLASRKAAA